MRKGYERFGYAQIILLSVFFLRLRHPWSRHCIHRHSSSHRCSLRYYTHHYFGFAMQMTMNNLTWMLKRMTCLMIRLTDGLKRMQIDGSRRKSLWMDGLMLMYPDGLKSPQT